MPHTTHGFFERILCDYTICVEASMVPAIFAATLVAGIVAIAHPLVRP